MNSTGPPDFTPASYEDLTATFGVLLLGFIFSVVLYGLTFFQTYVYYTRFPADHMGTKCIVGLLWAIDTAATSLMSHTIYHFLITNFLSAFDELVTTKTFIAEQILDALLVLLVQCYYAFRVWSITGKQLIVSGLLVLLGLASCGLNIASVAFIAQQDTFAHIVTHEVKLLRSISSAVSVVADVAIVAVMMYHLHPVRNPGMAVAQGWYEKTVMFGFNRGTVFTVVQVIHLVIFLAMPSSQAWILVGWVASKLYVISAFAMLNFRNTHRGRGVHEEDSLNQAASNRSGSQSVPVSGRDTTHSVQFGVHPDAKPHDPMSLIELDMVGSRMDMFDDTNSKANGWHTGGPSKRLVFDNDLAQ